PESVAPKALHDSAGLLMQGSYGSSAAAEEKPSVEAATTWKRSQLGAHTIRVSIGDRDELPVRSLQAKVTVDGFFARVVLDVQVKNDRSSNYEGTFQLRLPEGASPYFFAFGESVLAIAGDAAAPAWGADQVRRMGTEPAEIMGMRAASWTGPKEARVVPKEK